MDLPVAQLEALVAIADRGSFEAAARHLSVTPSAISQRIRALESAAGRVLVQRASPCRPTDAGETLVRLGRQTQVLHADARRVLAPDDAPAADLPVAVNADSLATWFRDVLASVADRDGLALSLHVEDQAYTARLLRSGDCLAAVTSDPTSVQGCSVEPLGRMRYRPAAAPGFAGRWRGGRGYDWARMPVVVFNDKDDLQHRVLRELGVVGPTVVHRVPTSADFHEAIRRGLGWGLLPDAQLGPDVELGRLVVLRGRVHVDVTLHWQRWRLDSPPLNALTDDVRRAASAHLRR